MNQTYNWAPADNRHFRYPMIDFFFDQPVKKSETTHYENFLLPEPRVCDIGSAWCQLEWSTVRNPGVGSIEYLLQMQHISNATKEEETQQVYRGPDPSFRLTSLSPNTEYHVKACAVRRTEDGSINLIGNYHNHRRKPQPKRQERQKTVLSPTLASVRQKYYQILIK